MLLFWQQSPLDLNAIEWCHPGPSQSTKAGFGLRTPGNSISQSNGCFVDVAFAYSMDWEME
jgi:hypothetical protein